MQRLDHAMIFLLIAGTATPVFLIATHGVVRLAGRRALLRQNVRACLHSSMTPRKLQAPHAG